MKCEDRLIQEEIFDRADKKIVASRQERSYKQHASIRNCSMILGLLTLMLTVILKIKFYEYSLNYFFQSEFGKSEEKLRTRAGSPV